MRISTDERGILLEYGVNRLRVQPWGPDGIRVMMTAETEPDLNDWALTGNANGGSRRKKWI